MEEISRGMHQSQEEEEEKDENESLVMPDEAFLFELNLVMIVASLTLSTQELSEYEDMEKLSVKEQQQDVQTFVSKMRSRKREFKELRIPDRRATRLQTRILDSRHGRKM